ncbi:MAG: type IV secretion system protein [Neisseriaceae bacterium]|nr:type IV secretion system protein [Neisseriaceae bacterium]
MKKKFILPLVTTAFLCLSGSVNASMLHIQFPTGIVVSMQKAQEQFLRLYVVNYESYSWDTIQQTFDTTIAMSDENVAEVFQKIHLSKNHNSPVKVLKQDCKIFVTVKSVNFDGEFAKVHFTKTFVNNKTTAQINLVATVGLKYQGTMPDKAQELNPLGYKVTHYQVEKEQG